jgi:hypothetical protein
MSADISLPFPQLTSILRCPSCGAEREETMPTDACQIVYVCPSCQATLRPRSGDCCVFCSYGSVPCPPVQLETAGGTSPEARS